MSDEIEQYDDFDAVERAADGALDRAARPRLFDRLSWFRLVAAHSPPVGAPLILRARTQNGEAWLFLARQGRRAVALANWYSLTFGAVASGDSGAAVAAIARGLRARGLARVELYPLAACEPLAAAFAGAGWIVACAKASVCWRIDTAGMSFEEYWARRPSRLRNTAKRKAKAAALDIVIHRDFDDRGWADYEAVYAASWKPEEGSPALMRALAEQEGAAGALRLGVASKDGRPIAAQLWLVENGVATIHKLAYAEAAKNLSPGTILSMAMFREALDVDHVAAIDFGTGDDAYKAEWMDDSTPLYRLVAHNPATLQGLAGAARNAACRLVGRARSR